MNLSQELDLERRRFLTRRWFFQQCGSASAPSPSRVAPRRPDRSRQSSRGAGSDDALPIPAAGARQIGDLPVHGRRPQPTRELFDHKPTLAKYNGQPVLRDILGGQTYAFIKPDSAIYAPEFQFAQHGQQIRGLDQRGVSRTRPRRRRTDHRPVHVHRRLQPRAGSDLHEHRLVAVRASQHGRLVTYGLGSVSQDLPGFVVKNPPAAFPAAAPAITAPDSCPPCSGRPVPKGADPVLYLSNPAGMSACSSARPWTPKELNEQRLGVVGDPEIATRINAFEMAYRMQSSAPELMDPPASPRKPWRSTARSPARRPSPTTACSPAAPSNAGFASSNCSTKRGITTAT